jgi:phospholipid/cholesterol/gamma-HCH transport system substrate-binding protein
MKPDHLELKVGIVALICCLLAAILILVIEDIKLLQNDYIVKVGFSNSQLLLEGANVNMSGVKIGRVKRLYLNLKPSQKNKVIVDLEIYEQFEIPADSRFHVATSGLFGTWYIRITPPANPKTNEIKFISKNSKEVFQGFSSSSIEELINQGRTTLVQVENILKHVESVVGDPELSQGVKQIIRNFEATSAQTKTLVNDLQDDLNIVSNNVLSATGHLKEILESQKDNVMNSLENLSKITKNLEEITRVNKQKIRSVLARLDQIIADIQDDGKLKLALSRIRENFVTVSDNLERVTRRATNMLENPELETRVHGAIQSATDAANALADIKQDLYSIETEFSTQVLYSNEDRDFKSSFFVDTEFKDRYTLKVGIEDPDKQADISMIHGGIHRGDTYFHAGITRNKFGIGYEKTFLGERLHVGLETYDLNDPIHRIFGMLRINDHTSFMIKFDQLRTSNKDFLMGVSHTF